MSNKDDSISEVSQEVLIGASLVAGLIGGGLVSYLTQSILFSILAGIVTALVYPVIGAIVVPICESLRHWAHQGKVGQWTREDTVLFGAFWPFTLLFSLIYYIFLGIINRIY